MRSLRFLLVWALCAPAALGAPAPAPAPARISPPGAAQAAVEERDTFVSQILSRPDVRALTAGRRTRVLRVWTDVEKRGAGIVRRATVLLRDYDAGVARELTADLPDGPVVVRELVGVPPSEEEIEEAAAIARRDPALAAFSRDPGLRLIGGFHNRSRLRNDPCARDVCLELAFMKPSWQGPARYVVVDLSRGVVAHHDFRGSRPGGAPASMTEASPK